MLEHGTPSVDLGWYMNFLADVIQQLPRPGQIDETTAQGWHQNKRGLKRVLLRALTPPEIKPSVHAIDCDTDPFTPDGWKVEEHKKGGLVKIERREDELYIDEKKIEFYLSRRQMGDKSVEGNQLREEVSKKPVLNANVLDYLLAHPELLPDSWKLDGGLLFFWGTVYRDSDGGLYVRCLYLSGGRWDWNTHWLDDRWGVRYPAAVSAS